MREKNEVFEKNYRGYLEQISRRDLGRAARILGGRIEEKEMHLSFFGTDYRISGEGISDASGKRASYRVCIIFFKHILLCPDTVPETGKWTAYREFKDAGPLIGFFAKDVEQALADHFSGKVGELEKNCRILGGFASEEELPYDLAVEFEVLPRIPMLLLCNDADEEFPARCTVLFRRSIGDYLDMESVAVLGSVLTDCLKEGKMP